MTTLVKQTLLWTLNFLTRLRETVYSYVKTISVILIFVINQKLFVQELKLNKFNVGR